MANPISFTFNSEIIYADANETIAAAILKAGIRVLRTTRENQKPRGIFCGIGICFDCLVTVDGTANQRACLIEAVSGMNVVSQ